MKRIILIVQFFICFNTFSQGVADSIVSTSNQWSILSYGLVGENEICCENSKYIKFSEDTIIGSLSYLKVYETTDSLKNNWSMIGYIREAENKVYAIKKGESKEGLIYEFNVNINDTVIVKNPFWSIDSVIMQVVSIDSINTLNGIKKRIELSNKDYSNEYWVEGMGSLMGVINSCAFSVGGQRTLLCFWKNDQLQYSNSDYDECFISDITSINSIQRNENNLKVYPNPFIDEITIKMPENLKNQQLGIKVFNCDGQNVYSALIVNNTKINLSKLNNGIYFYSFKSIDETLFGFGKIIKQ